MDDAWPGPGVERFRVWDLLIDLSAEVVRRGDREVPLHRLTFDLLAELVRRHPGVVSGRTLMDALWPDVFVGEENLKQRVRLLRRALGDDARDPSYVGTVRGRGYRIVAPVRPLGPGADGPARDPRRVAVAVFANRTGRSDLDPVARIATDWLAGRLVTLPGARIVPSSTSLIIFGRLRDSDGRAAPEEVVQVLARECGAGTVICGFFVLERDALIFRAQVVETDRGWTLHRVVEAGAPLDDPILAIDRLGEQVLIAVSEHLDPRAPLAGWNHQPPRYAAYRSYVEGLELFVRMRFRRALDHFDHAVGEDSDFAAPLLMGAIARWNLGEHDLAERLVARAELMEHRLGPLETLILEALAATFRGDRMSALERTQRTAELAPASPWVFEAGRQAVLSNLPRQAIDTLYRLDPDHGPMKGWEPYWFYIALSHHVLGEYAAELEAAAEAGSRHPISLWPHAFELRARIGLGDDDEVAALVRRVEGLPAHGNLSAGSLLALASRELLAHGRPQASRRVAERALAWYSEREAPAHRLELARLEILAERLDAAEERYRELDALEAQAPGHAEVIGSLGMLAARRHDHGAAERAAERLCALDGPYLFGASAFWRAAIAGWSGRLSEAVSLLAEAVTEGYPFGWPGLHPHEDPALAPLRDHEGFRTWIAPRG